MTNQKFKYQAGCSLLILVIFFNSSLSTQASERSHFVANSFLPSQRQENAITQNLSALELFRKVYENRYTWDNQFPGYTAVVEIKQGNNKYNGNVRVNSDLNVEVTGIDNEQASQTVKNQLLMIAIHRRQTPFAVAHKNKTFKFGTAKNPGVVEILEAGGKTPARYQIASNQIVRVSRLLGPHNVVVKTLDTEVTPAGYIATQYHSTFYDAKSDRLVGEEIYTDTYKEVDNYYLLTRQVIQSNENGNESVVELNFKQIKLMPSTSNN